MTPVFGAIIVLSIYVILNETLNLIKYKLQTTKDKHGYHMKVLR